MIAHYELLCVDKVVVNAILDCDRLIVGGGFDETTLGDDENLICAADCAETVSDADGSAVF